MAYKVFFSLPYTTQEIHKFVHFWHLPFSCPMFFQCPEESFLVVLEHDIILLSSPFLHIFCQLYFFVPHLVQPYFSHISLVGTCRIFLTFSHLALRMAFSLAVAFLHCFLLYNSLWAFAIFCRSSLISFFSLCS